ncbi:signal peptidase I [Phycicoccus sp. 3266]|uniref:signal peptidase I n=1 Tax=Phycicoccus sp. 3266 TaxID=2817751 RepID=UPI002867A895|nr:signal peptidase I [Phycicoccus sp. 3266]MDR6864322.1 signal peptidase I [Phycicoccus sp. 3266]
MSAGDGARDEGRGRRHGHGEGDGWLGWERGSEPADVDPTSQDQADETTGPWLRHDLSSARSDQGGSAREGSPWLAPELDVPDHAAAREAAPDTAVPPAMAGGQSSVANAGQSSVPTTGGSSPRRWTPPPTAPPATQTLPAAHTQPVRVADTDPSSGAAEDAAEAATGPSRRHRRHGDDEGADTPAGGLAVLGAAVKEFAIVVGMALVLSFVVKTWLLQAFYIPSGSMENTLQVNDRVIVSKLTPGPFDLRRGDIVVFGDPGNWVEAPVEQQHGKVVTLVRDTMMFIGLLPDDAENHLIKRVIGLPGDHVVCCDAGGRLTVNGQPVKEPYLKPGVAPSDQNFDITVPRGRVWVMGDNRSGSSDSRFHDAPTDDGSLGSVDERLIVGRAVALVWPLDHMTWLSNPSSTFRKVPAPAADSSRFGDPGGSDGTGGTGTEAPTTGGGTVDGGTGG